jgi:hypothetical protein
MNTVAVGCPEKPLEWHSVQWTIADFIKYAPLIDCNPVGQRPSVEPDPIGIEKASKAQSIINSILQGLDVGEIKIDQLEIPDLYRYESIDGGNRKRAILGFVQGIFPTHKSSVIGEKYYSQLTDSDIEYFSNYVLRFVIFKHLTIPQKGEIFRSTNNVTPVNHAEMRNSYGNIPIANMIRNTARHVQGIGNVPHILFDSYYTKGGKETFRNVGFDNARLKIDEAVARITYRCFNGETLGTSSNDELKAFYENESLDEATVSKLQKKVVACLDFIQKVSSERKVLTKKGVTFNEFTMLYRLYFHYLETKGKFRVVDYNAFAKVFTKAFVSFDNKKPSKYAKELVKEGKVNRIRYEAFKQHLGEHKTMFKMKNTIEWFTHEFDETAATVFAIDKQRNFENEDIQAQLARQDYKDWVDGKPLTMKDAQGAHVKAHSKGGRTDVYNLIVTHKDHNSRMQTMDPEEYKKVYSL